MKKIIYLLVVIFVLLTLVGCMNNDNETLSSTSSKNGVSSYETASLPEKKGNLGEYTVDVKGCRLAKDTEGKDIVIVNYGFANHAETSTSFTFAISDKVFQDGVGLNKCYNVAGSAKYSSENQSKNIKKDASIEVEVAYILNDSTTPIEVECTELISFSNNKVTKNFNIK